MPQACYAEKSAQVTAQDLNNIFCSLSWAPLAVQGIPNISIDERAMLHCGKMSIRQTLSVWLNTEP